MFVFAPSFFLNTLPSFSELRAEESAGVPPRGVVAADVLSSASSSASMPNESLPLAATLRFFRNKGFGVAALYFVN